MISKTLPEKAKVENKYALEAGTIEAIRYSEEDALANDDEEEDSDEKEFRMQLLQGETPHANVVIIPSERTAEPVQWRNGLGVSRELVVRPETSTRTKKDPFIFRLTRSELYQDRAALSRHDGYDITLVPLPEKSDARNSSSRLRTVKQLQRNLGVTMQRSLSCQPGQTRSTDSMSETDEDECHAAEGWYAVLQQNDRQDHLVPLNCLSITTYDGAIPTTMHVQDRLGMSFLTLTVNRARATATTNVYTVSGKNSYSSNSPQPAMAASITRFLSENKASELDFESGDEATSPSGDTLHESTSQLSMSNKGRKLHILMLCEVCIIVAIKQDLNVTLEQAGQVTTHHLKQGSVLLVERTDRHTGPIQVSVSHARRPFSERMSAVEKQMAALFEPEIVKDGPQKVSHAIPQPSSSTFVVFQIRQQEQSVQEVPFGLKRKGSILILDDSTTVPIAATGENGMTARHPLGAKLYHEPSFSEIASASEMAPSPIVVDSLVIDDFPPGCISSAWVNMVKQGLGEWIRVPLLIARGVQKGPVVGLTAVVHGNELNGLKVVHHVLDSLDVHHLKGTIVAVPCVNVPGFLRFQREYSDGKDLNRLFPGCPDGTASQVYCFQLITRILQHFHYHIDLHTASFGRINSYYVRSDMNDAAASKMAVLMQPQIILHNSGQDGTLRSAAASRGIRSITVEIGNPQLFQTQYIQWAFNGILRILLWLDMMPMVDLAQSHKCRSILCSRGFWIYTQTGGVLEVYPEVGMIFHKGDVIARIRNIFGTIVDQIVAPTHGITIGKSSNPVAQVGDRIIHVGVIKRESDELAKVAKENY